jgi:metal-responsive CopG/Arc/MetJ family transcriptional regulator
MKQVTIRLELRVSEEMNEFLQIESQSRKLSFEGLILMYLEEQMKKETQERQHNGPRDAPGGQKRSGSFSPQRPRSPS